MMKKYFLFLLLAFNFSCSTNNITTSNLKTDKNVYFYSEKDGKYQIYKYDTDRKQKINITNDSGSNYSYNLDSGKSKIAYISSENNKNILYIMDLSGKNKNKIFDKNDCSNPVIAPNGKQVAFISENKIFTINSDGLDLRELAPGLTNSSPNWSADSKKIAFESNKNIYSVNSDGSALKKLTNNPVADQNDSTKITNNFFIDPSKIILSNSQNYSPVWSPNGKKIAFVSNRDAKWNIYTINNEGTDEKKLSDGKEDIMPNWSPDGKKLAFVSKKEIKNEDISINQINIINEDGTGLNTINEANQNSEPSWSEDGNFIVFSSAKNGNNDIFVANLKTMKTVNITNSSESDFSPKL